VLSENYSDNAALLASDIAKACQILLEFMDKGMKGLLSGDLSALAVREIQKQIEAHLPKLLDLEGELASVQSKQALRVQKQVYEHYLRIEPGKLSQAAKLKLEQFQGSEYTLGNLSSMKRAAKMDEAVNFTGVEQQRLSGFQDLENLQQFLSQKQVADLKEESQQAEKRVQKVLEKTNEVINGLYDAVAQKVFQLDSFLIPYHGIPQPQKENPMNLFKRQLKIEELSFELAHKKYQQSLNDLIKIGKADQLATSHRYIISWMRAMEQAVTSQQKIIVKRAGLDPSKRKVDFFLIQMPSDKISALCVMHMMKLLFSQFLSVHKQFDDLASESQEERKLMDSDTLKIPSLQLFLELGRLFDHELKKQLQTQTAKKTQTPSMTPNNHQIEEHLLVDDHSIGTLSKKTQIKIGGFLTNLMCQTLKYRVGKREHFLLQPMKQRKDNLKQQGFLVFNKGFVEKFISELDKIHDLNLQLERSLPMVYPPAPWKNYYFGGYYLKQTKMAKVDPQFQEAIQYMKRADLSNLCHVLNLLGGVPWRVNKRVLDAIEFIWSNGGGKAMIPKRHNDRHITPDMIRAADFKDKLKMLREHKLNCEDHSLRCDFLLRLSMAQSFKSCDRIYFPHNIDFRGRVYPIPPHLNHMGADLNRGILEFSEPKPLGKNGLRWMKIHLANKIGKDKLPLDERAKYSESIMEMVHRCAQDPFSNLEWLDSDSPWQTLACMFELSEAVKSPDPEKYMSRLHIHVDGSCNGMQHYAAFGRDSNGGRQVNLADSPRPGDVYTAILRLVLRDIENEPDERN
jgi:DNA-directed RNA polymerase